MSSTAEAILAAVPMGVYVVDDTLRICEGNPVALANFAGADFLGSDLAETIHRAWLDPYASDVVRRFQHTLATGEPYVGGDAPQLRIDHGKVEANEWSLRRIVLADGRFGVVCIFHEASAAIRARGELADSESRYRALFDTMDDGVMIIERKEPGILKLRDWRYVTMNRASCSMFGKPDLTGKSMRSNFPDEDEEWYDIYDRALESPRPFRIVRESRPQSMVLELFLSRVGAPSEQRLMIVMRDVTQRTHAEQLLRESEERKAYLLSLTDALRDLVEPSAIEAAAARVLGENLRCSRVVYGEIDPATGEYTVREEHLAAGMPPSPPRWRASELGAALEARFRSGRVLVVRDVAVDPLVARDRRSVEPTLGSKAFIAVPLVKAGRFVAFLAAQQANARMWTPSEIARVEETAERTWAAVERASVEKELREREEMLRDADRKKDEFLAVLAHELRNPLAPIRTGLELLRQANGAPQLVERVRTTMERQVEHMVRLVDDLLDVSRITTGKIRLQREPMSLAALVNTAVEANRAGLDAGRIELTTSLADCVVDVDPTRFVQVVSNLVHNAVKFTPAGGSVRVVASLSGEDVAIAVIDSGAGIVPEMLPRVFELFTQGDADTRRPQVGLGIGLALARQLVELHGGTISAESDGRGKGSTLTVRIPHAVVPPASSPAPRSGAGPIAGRRVVVVDDNEDSAEMMAILIATLGGECRTAHDGESGVELVGQWKPEVVLLDIGLPGIDGYEACRQMRALLGTTVKIIALTGRGQERDKVDARAAGFDLHLTKPVDPNALQRVLAR